MMTVWQLAGIEAKAFRPRSRYSLVRHLVFRLAMIVVLLGYQRRVHPSGRALCLLEVKRGRQVCFVLAIALASALLAGAVPVAALGFSGVLLGAGTPGLLRKVRWRRAARRLQGQWDGGPVVRLHSLASVEPGAGAELVSLVMQEMAERQRSLVLDAANDRLAQYYESLGFERCGETVNLSKSVRRAQMRWPQVSKGGPVYGTLQG